MNQPLPQSRAEIAALIPHQGDMCLLERVLHCSEESITCASTTHQRIDHPLRHAGRLSAVHLCEYGAQATAAHGALLLACTGNRAPPGMLVALRDATFGVEYLDECAEAKNCELHIEARLLSGGATGSMYHYIIKLDTLVLAQGKATIMNWSES